MTTYKPKGTILPFLAAVEAEPKRVFLATEAAYIMNIPVRKVSATIKYAVEHLVVYRSEMSGRVVYRGVPFDDKCPKPLVAATPRRAARRMGHWQPSPDDLRIPRVVPGWLPPKMVPPRAGV